MRVRPCRECGEDIVFLEAGQHGRWIPVDAESVDGEDRVYEPRAGHVSHLETCVARERRVRDARGG